MLHHVLTVAILPGCPVQFSKLGKVMRHISQLDQAVLPIPREEVYHIQKRADVLLERWQVLISASGDAGATSTVNGAESKVERSEKPTEKKDEVKVVGVDKTKDVPVNGTKTGAATEAPVDPPATEDEIAMDTADD
jgi:hypothetical protein